MYVTKECGIFLPVDHIRNKLQYSEQFAVLVARLNIAYPFPDHILP